MYQPVFPRLQFLLVVLPAMGLAGCAARQPVAPPPAPTAQLAWTAAIGKLDVAGAQPCTAILVGPETILTASHCLHQQAVPADPGTLRFHPNFGIAPDMPPADGIALRAQGGAIQEGHLQRPEQVAADWALITVSPPVTRVAPLPLAHLSTAEIQARIAGGAKLFTAGYGNGSMKILKQHSSCGIVDPPSAEAVYATGMLVTTCIIRIGDSGGPVVLLDNAGKPQLVGVFAGFGINAKTGLSYAANAGNVVPYMSGGLVSAPPVIWLSDQAFLPDLASPPLRSADGGN